MDKAYLYLIENYLEEIILDIQNETIYLRDVDLYKNKKDIMISCPCHKGGMEDKASCGIEKETGLVNCFTCGFSGNIISLSKECRGEEYGFKYLKDRYLNGINVEEEKRDIRLNFNKTDEEEYYEIPDLPSVVYFEKGLNYLLNERKLKLNVIENFKIKYDENKEMIMIPITIGNEIIGYKGRRIFKCNKKYRFYNTPKMKKVLFGLDKIKKGNAVFITEAEIDCLTLWGWGIECISMLGSSITPLQVEQLKHSIINKLYILMDNDDAGKEAAKNLIGDLKDTGIELFLCRYENTNNKDVNEFDNLEELKKSLKFFKVK